MNENTVVKPQITKTIGVIDAPNILKFTGDSEDHSNNKLRMVPIIFTSDRDLMDRTLQVMTDCGRRADVLFEDLENLIKYVPEVTVNVHGDAPLGLDKLLVRPSIVVMDKSLAETLGVEIRNGTLQYARIAAMVRS